MQGSLNACQTRHKIILPRRLQETKFILITIYLVYWRLGGSVLLIAAGLNNSSEIKNRIGRSFSITGFAGIR